MDNLGKFKKRSRINSSSLIDSTSTVDNFYDKFNFSEPQIDSITDYHEKPSILRAFYDDDLNLILIHNIVRAKFIFEKRELSSIIEQIEYFNKIIAKNEISLLEINSLRLKIEELTKIKDKSLNSQAWNLYSIKSIPILQEYLTVMSNLSRGIFVIGGIEQSSAEIYNKRFACIDSYLEIISVMKILEVEVVRRTNDNLSSCPMCSISFENVTTNEEGLYICSCGYTLTSLHSSSDFNDSNKIQNSIPEGDTLNAFLKWLNRYQGTSSEVLDPQIFIKFDAWCVKNGYPTGESFKHKTNNPIYVPNLSFLIRIMIATGHTKLYYLKNVIRHLYWGWNLPILDQNMINQLTQDYIKTQIVYSEIKTHKSNLNMELRGYGHLKAIGHECSIEDFKIPTSEDTIEYANKMFSVMRERTGVKFPRIVI